MRRLLGFVHIPLGKFYQIFGNDRNPSAGTENKRRGRNATKRVKRYTRPIVHPDSSVTYDDLRQPKGTITGTRKRVVARVDNNCSRETLDKLKTEHLSIHGNEKLLSLEEVKSMGWFHNNPEDL